MGSASCLLLVLLSIIYLLIFIISIGRTFHFNSTGTNTTISIDNILISIKFFLNGFSKVRCFIAFLLILSVSLFSSQCNSCMTIRHNQNKFELSIMDNRVIRFSCFDLLTWKMFAHLEFQRCLKLPLATTDP